MRILVLSIGNTSLFGGVFSGAGRIIPFRLPAADLVSVSALVAGRIDGAVVCSVVPELTPDVMGFIRRSWNLDAHLVTYDSPHGLTLGYRQPRQLGTDRIATALGAQVAYPKQNVVVVDCGTATTVTALRRDGTLLGGAILPGLSSWPEMLATATAQLPRVMLRRPRVALARSTEEAIASGVFFGHTGAIRETVLRVRAEAFGRGQCQIVGTGGHAERFAREKLFTVIEPTLILQGLRAFAARIFPL
jgi:type III pantothenate kinase